MIFYIPNVQTIKEYNYLKKTQKPVNINKTTKELDEFIYNKYNGIRNIGIILAAAGINIFVLKNCVQNIKKNKMTALTCFLTTLGIDGIIAHKMLDIEKNRQKNIKDTNFKMRKYKQSGLNAVV